MTHFLYFFFNWTRPTIFFKICIKISLVCSNKVLLLLPHVHAHGELNQKHLWTTKKYLRSKPTKYLHQHHGDKPNDEADKLEQSGDVLHPLGVENLEHDDIEDGSPGQS